MGMFDQEGLDPTAVSSDYCVDIAMVIDSTGSMAPIIEEVKSNASDFYQKFLDAMQANGKNASQVRIKVIDYRDYKCDGQYAMNETGFFTLPAENDVFQSAMDAIEAKGGGDEPESAYEALALAMRSDWTTEGNKRRHVILLFTDASACSLGDSSRTSSPHYPANMPSDLAQLGDMWNGLAGQELAGMPEQTAKRMVVFAPQVESWTNLEGWEQVWTSYSQAGMGCDNVDIDMAIQLLVNSVG